MQTQTYIHWHCYTCNGGAPATERSRGLYASPWSFGNFQACAMVQVRVCEREGRGGGQGTGTDERGRPGCSSETKLRPLRTPWDVELRRWQG